MRIDKPQTRHIPDLRELWREAFGDTEDFLDQFFGKAFSPDRCRCVLEGDKPVAAVYWFHEFCRGKPVAYLYAVATRITCRGRGLCRELLARTHRDLEALGYAGAVLVPADPELAGMYRRMGYEFFGGVTDIPASAGETAAALEPVDGETYHRLREKYLPAGSVFPDKTYLPFLESQARLYAGEDFLLAAVREEECLVGLELLGNVAAAPGILKALGMEAGTFRTPGSEKTFAMYRGFGAPGEPAYFGLAFQ